MKQRNTTGYGLVFTTLGVEVGNGDVIDHPDLLPGFTPVKDEKPKTKVTGTPAPEPESAAAVPETTVED